MPVTMYFFFSKIKYWVSQNINVILEENIFYKYNEKSNVNIFLLVKSIEMILDHFL